MTTDIQLSALPCTSAYPRAELNDLLTKYQGASIRGQSPALCRFAAHFFVLNTFDPVDDDGLFAVHLDQLAAELNAARSPLTFASVVRALLAADWTLDGDFITKRIDPDEQAKWWNEPKRKPAPYLKPQTQLSLRVP